MRALLTLVRKDLRLLWRDRAGLTFLTLAPVMVITVAGFSLANLYGSDPSGQTAYEFPLVDEDGGALARRIHDALAHDPAVHLRSVATRGEAEQLVREKRAGSGLVIPHGTEAALDAGEIATLVLYTDPVKYLERLNVRTRLLELRNQLAVERRDAVAQTIAAQRAQLQREVARLHAAVARARGEIERSWLEAGAARDAVRAQLERQQARLRRTIAAQVERDLTVAMTEIERHVDAQLEAQTQAVGAPLHAYLESVSAARSAFGAWFDELRRRAGARAAAIPAPPAFPELPPDLMRALRDGLRPIPIPSPPAPDIRVQIPTPALPPLPPLPAFDLPALALPEPPAPPGALNVREVTLGGGPLAVNTFDQNVPGFSVTFLLLGMLLGVSLGLLDERDWGTFDRLRAMPIVASQMLVGKLLSRFVVGVVQMVVLFAVGRIAFGISLGPQPWALLLPTAGIVFAGTAFGLIVAAITASREAVLPVGSIVIVTMAAVGGCWWPIDLEPRWMRTVALAFPTTWAMDAFNDLMIRRRHVEAALVPTAVMLAYGLLYLSIGVTLFHARLQRRR